jgi:hypothetical protein
MKRSIADCAVSMEEMVLNMRKEKIGKAFGLRPVESSNANPLYPIDVFTKYVLCLLFG